MKDHAISFLKILCLCTLIMFAMFCVYQVSEQLFFSLETVIAGIVLYCIALVSGYAIGSIPTAYLVGRLRGIDITQEGSGNVGTANALRTMGKLPALIVFVVDFLKGFAMCIFHDTGGDYRFMLMCCVGCLIGHCYSVWIDFKGGKAVATGIGTLFAVDWRVGLAAAVTYIALVAITRYSSLASMCAAIAGAVAMPLVYRGNWWLIGYAALLAVYIVWRHRDNITRLRSGTEPKIGQKTEKS